MKKDNPSTVWWWLAWIGLTIGSFFVSCWFWTLFIARHVGTMQQPGAPILWVAAVFGSWMVLLVPLIVVMYRKVDKAYEDARIQREKTAFQKAQGAFRIKSIFIENSKRALNKNLGQKLKSMPETIRRGHLVTAVLRDGRQIENVFILNKKEVLGVYGLEALTFEISDIVDILPCDLDRLPNFKSENWLRLDGVGSA